MACVQFIQIEEETTRGTSVGSSLLSIPVKGNLMPDYNPEDTPRSDFRGPCTALGNVSVERTSSQWTYSLQTAYYPNAAIGLLLKHSNGKAGTRSVVDTTAYEGMVYPLPQPYGTGRELGSKAVGIWVVYEKEGTSYKRYYGGGRITSGNMATDDTGDVNLTFELTGAGEWVGSEAVNDLTFTAPTETPFTKSDIAIYANSGVSRTGTAPDYTDISPGTMDPMYPDNLDLTWTCGLSDKTVINGTKGPSKTTRENQYSAEFTASIDLADPSSGSFSSWDDYTARFNAPHTNSLLVVLDNGELAGSATENYKATFDLPSMLANHDTPEIQPDGTQGTINLNYSSLNSETTEYPLGILTVDQASAY